MTWLETIAAKIMIGAIMAGMVFSGGYVSGRKSGKMEQLADSVKAFETRIAIDARVQNASGYQLCRSLGGLPDECKQLRGLDAAPASE